MKVKFSIFVFSILFYVALQAQAQELDSLIKYFQSEQSEEFRKSITFEATVKRVQQEQENAMTGYWKCEMKTVYNGIEMTFRGYSSFSNGFARQVLLSQGYGQQYVGTSSFKYWFEKGHLITQTTGQTGTNKSLVKWVNYYDEFNQTIVDGTLKGQIVNGKRVTKEEFDCYFNDPERLRSGTGCQGGGDSGGAGTKPCPACGGSKGSRCMNSLIGGYACAGGRVHRRIERQCTDSQGHLYDCSTTTTETCSNCNGTGINPCTYCGGKGYVKQ